MFGALSHFFATGEGFAVVTNFATIRCGIRFRVWKWPRRWERICWVSLHFESYAGKPGGCSLVQMSLTMSDSTQLKTWVTRGTKQRFSAVARHQGLSDSA